MSESLRVDQNNMVYITVYIMANNIVVIGETKLFI